MWKRYARSRRFAQVGWGTFACSRLFPGKHIADGWRRYLDRCCLDHSCIPQTLLALNRLSAVRQIGNGRGGITKGCHLFVIKEIKSIANVYVPSVASPPLSRSPVLRFCTCFSPQCRNWLLLVWTSAMFQSTPLREGRGLICNRSKQISLFPAFREPRILISRSDSYNRRY